MRTTLELQVDQLRALVTGSRRSRAGNVKTALDPELADAIAEAIGMLVAIAQYLPEGAKREQVLQVALRLANATGEPELLRGKS